MSEEHKRKISLANIGKLNGLKQTPERVAQRTKYIIGNKWNVGKKQSLETIQKRIKANTGKKRTQETKDKISAAHRGMKKPWAKFTEKMIGEKNCNWKGGITEENHKIRTSLEFKLWRKSCMERDDFTCQKTGQRGGELVVHHIHNFADYPELRLAIDNGITLSKKSHQEFHKKYGIKNNTKEQLVEFIALK